MPATPQTCLDSACIYGAAGRIEIISVARALMAVSCIRNIWSMADPIQDLEYCGGASMTESRRDLSPTGAAVR